MARNFWHTNKYFSLSPFLFFHFWFFFHCQSLSTNCVFNCLSFSQSSEGKSRMKSFFTVGEWISSTCRRLFQWICRTLRTKWSSWWAAAGRTTSCTAISSHAITSTRSRRRSMRLYKRFEDDGKREKESVREDWKRWRCLWARTPTRDTKKWLFWEKEEREREGGRGRVSWMASEWTSVFAWDGDSLFSADVVFNGHHRYFNLTLPHSFRQRGCFPHRRFSLFLSPFS